MIIHKPRKGSIFNNPQCLTKSAFDKNFKARANSKKPKTTFTVFSQPPDLGKDFIHPGNAANKVNGRASASPKPPIPAVNCMAPPSEDSAPASNDPKIGPVHENETKERVSAMKKTPMMPPAFSA